MIVQDMSTLGPGKLQKKDKNDPFILAKSNYIDLQVYILKGKTLPTTLKALQESWNISSSVDVSEFAQLIKDYQDIVNHTTNWETNSLPKLRNLADQIYEYGLQAPDFYGVLLESLTTLADPNATLKAKQQAIQDFKQVAAALSDQIKGYEHSCVEVQNDINTFRSQTQQDHQNLQHRFNEYNTKFNSTNGDIEQLKQQMTEWQHTLHDAEVEYKHDVIVASTSPSYAWVFPPLGLIAAAVVSGVYGDKATKAKNQMKAARQQIDSIGGEITRDQNMLIQLQDAKDQISDIDGKLEKALAVIDEVKDSWDSISSDLDGLSTRIDKISSDESAEIIKKLNVKSSITAWAELKNEANNFRHHFTVDVKGSVNQPAANLTNLVVMHAVFAA